MTIEEIKAQLARSAKAEQEHVMAYLVHLRHSRESAVKEEITRRMDDRDRSNWVTLDELEKRWKE
jgi:hypothetical protein